MRNVFGVPVCKIPQSSSPQKPWELSWRQLGRGRVRVGDDHGPVTPTVTADVVLTPGWGMASWELGEGRGGFGDHCP